MSTSKVIPLFIIKFYASVWLKPKQRKKGINQDLNTKQRKKKHPSRANKTKSNQIRKDMKPKQKQKQNKKHAHNNLELLEEVEKV